MKLQRKKTAFCTRTGLYEWNVLPFGLCNAVASFQRLMESILADMRFTSCLVYIDDLFVYGPTFDATLTHLTELCKRLRKANLKLKPKKCDFFQKSVIFLGHKISELGIETDPAKTAAVADWDPPKDKTAIKSFLGTVGYYRRFIPSYSTVAKPLTSLTSKETPFEWTKECQKSFETLKQSLLSAPILGYPKDDGIFIIDTDASNVGVGGVLSQIQNNKEVVIAYGSRTLTGSELNYCVTRKELLAVMHHVKMYRSYLLGRYFRVRTDHAALKYWRKFRDPVDQLGRWLDYLSQFSFDIEARPGVTHGNADGLSRRQHECDMDGKKKCLCYRFENLEFEPEVAIESKMYVDMGVQVGPDDLELGPWESEKVSQAVLVRRTLIGLEVSVGTQTDVLQARAVSVLPLWSVEEVCAAQDLDPVIGPVLKLLKESSHKPSWSEVSSHSSESKVLFGEWDRLRIKDGLLYRIWENDKGNSLWWQLALPKSLRDKVLVLSHDHVTTGHNGGQKTYMRVRSRFFWPGMREDIRRYVGSCTTCQMRKSPPAKGKAPMKSYLVGAPGERVATDLMGPFTETDEGFKWIMCIGDLFTKYCIAIPLKDMTAETVTSAFVSNWVSYFGVPLELHSDKGTQYESSLFSDTCALLGITKTRTTTMNPQSNGFIEHMNRTLCDMLNCVILENPFSWDTLIRFCSLAYNTSVHESTKETPSMLMYGREMILPLDLIAPVRLPDITPFQSEQEYVLHLQDKLFKAYNHARISLKGATQKQARQYDNRLKFTSFKVGEQVYYYYPVKGKHTSKESFYQWQGPFTIVKKMSDLIYRIQKGPKFKALVVHHNKLKRAQCRYDVDISWLQRNVLPPVQSNTEQNVSDRPTRVRHPPNLYGEWHFCD